jgi:processive 1,2-diacylglycerol beta-glucosyltransferase
MPRLYRVDNGQPIGEITPEQLQFLVDQLEEESDDDQDYYVDRDVLDHLRERGGDPVLLAMLEQAMGGEDELDIKWSA